MLIQSDWHIHSEYSYDAKLSLEEIAQTAKKYGFKKIGITDHANYNDEEFLGDLQNSAKNVKEIQKKHPNIILGVELTPIAKPKFDYIQKNGTREGYEAPATSEPYALELAQTKEELKELGVRYAIGAAHWRVDFPKSQIGDSSDIKDLIKEWYRQQMWLACDERVTILGHPWCNPIWYDDFSVIPRSMNSDIAAALKENGKYVECNEAVLCSTKASERFRRQYAEFLREFFEMGIPVTYGSDSHKIYAPHHKEAEKHLIAVGFSDGDIAGIADEHLW